MSPWIVAGDVGGTKANLALFEPRGGSPVPVREETYPSAEFTGPGPLVLDFMAKAKVERAYLCLGLPGPVAGGVVRTPNLPWVVHLEELKGLPGIEAAALLNDLEATGHGLALLGPDSLVELNPRAQERTGNRALLAAGTGLGEAILFWDGARWRPSASEGSHVDFAPRDEEEVGLLRFLLEETGHVSYDQVVSGPGLIRIHEFLSRQSPELDSGEAACPLADQSEDCDQAALISRSALEGTCPLCLRAMEMLVSLYGAEAGNLALKSLALGGVFLGGGITPKILPALRTGRFLESFLAKGRMAQLLAKIPVQVILEPKTALFGAARYALENLVPPDFS